jgi:hypothetical protein
MEPTDHLVSSESSPMVADSAVNPLAEGFRSDPRYSMVLKRMNLA